MLEVNGVTLQRGARRILCDVGFTLMPGQVLGVLGPNGAGKSTLLDVLAGLAAPQSGNALWRSQAVSDMKPSRRARTVGLLEQQCHCDGAFRVEELVALGAWPHSWSRRECRRQVGHAMSLTGLSVLAATRMDRLSGGERQRAHLARLLVQSPVLWLLDEPTNHLDMAHAHVVMALMRGKTAVVTLHDINLAARYCDQLLLMHDGRVVAMGSPDEVLQPERLKSVYGMEAHRLVSTAHPHPVIEFLAP